MNHMGCLAKVGSSSTTVVVPLRKLYLYTVNLGCQLKKKAHPPVTSVLPAYSRASTARLPCKLRKKQRWSVSPRR